MENDPTRIERFDRLFAAHFDAVRAYAWRRDPATADDVAAETFLVAWRRLEDIPADSLPWLIGVARNMDAKTALTMSPETSVARSGETHERCVAAGSAHVCSRASLLMQRA